MSPTVSPFDSMLKTRITNANIPPDKLLSPILCDIASKKPQGQFSTKFQGANNKTTSVDGRNEVEIPSKLVFLNSSNTQKSRYFSQDNKTMVFVQSEEASKKENE